MSTADRVFREVAVAGVGCAAVDGFFNPLEVLKVRLQARLSADPSMRSNILHEVKLVCKSDGAFGLWSAGLVPTMLRGLLYVGFRIGMYPTVKELCGHAKDAPEPFRVKLFAGAVCGGVGSAIFCPLDVVRIRMQANRRKYDSTWSALRSIYSADGIAGLWRGMPVNATRAALLSGTQLSVYDQTKTYLRDSTVTGRAQEGPLLHMFASFVSGSLAQLVIMPVDAMKTHIMLSAGAAGNSDSRGTAATQPASLSMRAAAQRLYAAGGVPGFYRGLLPALMRQGPSMLIQVCTRNFIQAADCR
jgi:hypothetical protein